MANILKGWKTSLIGTVIIAGALYSILRTGSTTSWFDASIGIAIGVGLLFVPDVVLKKITVLFRSTETVDTDSGGSAQITTTITKIEPDPKPEPPTDDVPKES